MSFGNTGGISRDQFTAAASVAGSLIRYSFYTIGAVVLGGIGLFMMWVWGHRVTTVDSPPAFTINAKAVSGLPVQSSILKVGQLGRVEIMHFGAIHNRETDLTAALFMPPNGTVPVDRLSANFHDANLLRNVRHIMTSTYHDLETRFGSIRAVEMRADIDGRWKQCLAYRSRFDHPSVYLMGWYCDGTGNKPSPHQLACTLDKLTLTRDLPSREANEFIRGRMARSANCSADSVSQTTDTSYRRGVSPPSRWSQPNSKRRCPTGTDLTHRHLLREIR